MPRKLQQPNHKHEIHKHSIFIIKCSHDTNTGKLKPNRYWLCDAEKWGM